MSDAANPTSDSPTDGQVLRLRRQGSRALHIVVDDLSTRCFEGETIATAILAQRCYIGSDAMRTHGLWCGIGICFECVVTVDGVPGIRACMRRVEPGINVRTQIDRGAAPAITPRAETDR